MNLKQAILSKSLAFFNNGVYALDNRKLFHDFDTSHLHDAAVGLWDKIKGTDPTVLVGKGVGSVSLLTAIKLVAYSRDQINLSMLFIRDERKNRGMFKKLVEGPNPAEVKGQRAVFVDDIFNKGKTYQSCKQVIFEEGFELQFVACAVLFDFWDGSRQLTAVGEPFISLYRRHDLGMTRKDDGLPTILDSIKWRQHVFHEGRDFMPVKSRPVAWNDRIYVGNDNTHFYCIDSTTGDTLWMSKSQRPSLKGAVCEAQLADGFVYWSAYDGTLKKANALTGELAWVIKLDLALHSSPALDPANNRAFIGTEWNKQGQFGQGDIVAVELSSGNELWRTPTEGMVPASPTYSVEADMVLCGSNDFHVYALNPDSGQVLAKLPTKGEVKGKVAVQGKIAVAVTTTGYVYGIDLEQLVILWERRIGLSTVHAFPIIEGGSCFVTNAAMTVFSLDLHTGFINWVAKLRGSAHWGVINVSQRSLLATTDNGYVVLLDKLTGEKLASDRMHDVLCYQPPAYHNQKLTMVTNNRGILCYDVNLEAIA